ncbi:MAG: peroxide stress protein YaaA [Eubacteriales bacterium]|nr:peroxide stress protein YaaA [Eubacteriales bacterium]
MSQKEIKIIISPAKKMKEKDALASETVPAFLPYTEKLLGHMREMSESQLRELWRCNASIAKENYERIQNMDLRKNLTPAVLSYEGIQYKYMAPAVFEEEAYEYLQKHLYILSGFYGAVRAFDGVTPYRLEMQARFRQKDIDSLYCFWGDVIAKEILKDCSGLVNLASKEYSKAVLPYVPASIPCITCVFGEVTDGKVREKGTYAKMARGEMVRFMAEYQIESLEDIKKFDSHGYRYAKEYSDIQKYVFVRQEMEKGR